MPPSISISPFPTAFRIYVYLLPSISRPTPSFILSSCGGSLVTSRCVHVQWLWDFLMLAANKWQGEQRDGLSGKAGLPTITVPVKTAEQSPLLNNQIRIPDRPALQLDPTHWNKWDRPETVHDRPILFSPYDPDARKVGMKTFVWKQTVFTDRVP